MSKLSWMLIGMAVQAFLVAFFLATSTLNVTPQQQGTAGILFVALAIALIGRDKQKKIQEP